VHPLSRIRPSHRLCEARLFQMTTRALFVAAGQIVSTSTQDGVSS
jgi:hypothetical protein